MNSQRYLCYIKDFNTTLFKFPTMVETDDELSIGEIGATVSAGFLLVIMLIVIGISLDIPSIDDPIYDQYITPLTLAASGLGMGHYIGRSLRERDQVRVFFMVGFFSAVFLQAIGVSVRGSTNNLFPVVVVLPALFALVMHISPIIPRDEDMTNLLKFLAGPITTAFIIISSFIEFAISLPIGLEVIFWPIIFISILLLLAILIVFSIMALYKYIAEGRSEDKESE